VWRVRAGVARARGDIGGAVRLLKQAGEAARTHGTAEVLSATERDLGAALEATGDTSGARAARERALEIFRRLGAADEIRALEALLG
jgi:Flp pilus assembly protein TadD